MTAVTSGQPADLPADPADAVEEAAAHVPAAPQDTAARRRQDRIAAGVLCAIGIFVIVTAVQLGIGTPEAPRAGLWPLVVGVVLTFTSLMVVREPMAEVVERFDRSLVTVVGGVVAIAAYAWLLERVGFELPTILMLILWLKVFGRESWRITAIVAVASAVVVYLLFIVLLNVSLPHLIVL